MNHIWILGALALFLCTWSGTYACTRDELEMVQIITKHGFVAPKSIFPEDPNPASVWIEGLEDLTMLGKFQAYALGVFLRNFYGDFIDSDPRQLEVISSSNKEAVKSAQSLVTALYSPTAYWEVVQNFLWQPIYIKYDTDDNQFLTNSLCPAADAEFKRVVSRETGALLQTYQSLLYYWSSNSGLSLKSVADVEQLFKTLNTEFSHNLTIPDWSQTYWDEMKYLHDVSVSLKVKTLKQMRLRGGRLIERTINSLRQKASSDEDSRKVSVYVTHKTPLLGLITGMDLGKFKDLPPCSTLLVELYKREGEPFVRFLLLNSTTPEREPQEIYSLTMPGCTEFCPLDYVVDYTRDLIPKNWARECLLV